MSKITNDGLARSGTRQLYPYGKSGRQRVNSLPLRPPVGPVHTFTYIIHSAHNENESATKNYQTRDALLIPCRFPNSKAKKLFISNDPVDVDVRRATMQNQLNY